MSQVTGHMFVRLALYFFIGVGGMFLPHTSGFASGEPQGSTSSEKSPSVPPGSSQSSPPTGTQSLDEKGQQELDELRKKPEEFRTLMTGVQIFLGRFGYGVGPYTGILDQSSKKALSAYQKKSGLSQTGDLDFPTLKRLTEDDRLMNRVVPLLPQQASTIRNGINGSKFRVRGCSRKGIPTMCCKRRESPACGN